MEQDGMNPYQSPQAASQTQNTQETVLSPAMLNELRLASPWLKFIGVFGFIAAGVLALAGIIFLITGGAVFMPDSLGGTFGAAGFGAAGIIYIAMALLAFFPAKFAYKFGSSLRAYTLNFNSSDLETAFRNNKNYFKFNGIIAIITLAAVPVSLIIAIIVAIAAF